MKVPGKVEVVEISDDSTRNLASNNAVIINALIDCVEALKARIKALEEEARTAERSRKQLWDAVNKHRARIHNLEKRVEKGIGDEWTIVDFPQGSPAVGFKLIDGRWIKVCAECGAKLPPEKPPACDVWELKGDGTKENLSKKEKPPTCGDCAFWGRAGCFSSELCVEFSKFKPKEPVSTCGECVSLEDCGVTADMTVPELCRHDGSFEPKESKDSEGDGVPLVDAKHLISPDSLEKVEVYLPLGTIYKGACRCDKQYYYWFNDDNGLTIRCQTCYEARTDPHEKAGVLTEESDDSEKKSTLLRWPEDKQEIVRKLNGMGIEHYRTDEYFERENFRQTVNDRAHWSIIDLEVLVDSDDPVALVEKKLNAARQRDELGKESEPLIKEMLCDGPIAKGQIVFMHPDGKVRKYPEPHAAFEGMAGRVEAL